MLYRKWLLAILLAILAYNFVDRLVLGLVLQDIKTDLGLTDTQLGLLSGLAFAAFYSLMGIPIARWADRGNRRLIVSLATALWSGAVALCALAGSFAQLLAIRVGVAVGEAGCVPPAHSLIADYFSRAERPKAVAVYMSGAPLSLVLGYFVAGWLNEAFRWRTTFALIGLPGLALAALAWTTLREPRLLSSKLRASESSRPVAPGVKEVLGTLWANITFRHLLLCFSVASFFGYGIGQWQAAFFVRQYGLKTGELGTWFTAVYGLGGLTGTYFGGVLASGHAAKDEPLQLRMMAIVYCASALVLSATYLTSNLYTAFAATGLAAAAAAGCNGPLFATIQTLVPERMRAMSIALIYLFANLIGMGLGPLAAGALSDALQPSMGHESLRYALLILCPGYFWAGWHLWRASRSVTCDLPR